MNFKKYYYNKLIKENSDVQFWGNKGAGIIIYCEKTNRFLLGLRSPYVNEPNTWGLFGGKFDDEVSAEEVARRELEEETGYIGSMKLSLIDVFKRPNFTFYNYLGVVPEEFSPKLDWENSDAQWFYLNQFPNNLHFGLTHILPKLKNI